MPLPDDKRKIYLVRHAESVWNSERRVQGTCPGVSLSPLGRRQAKLLGKRLALLDFSSVYCSTAERALETARIALGTERMPTILDDLRELSLGAWDGRFMEDIRREDPDGIDRWYRTPTKVRIDGGEPLESLRRRAVETMDLIIGSSDDGNMLVVTHGGFICAYLTHLLGMDLDDLWAFSLPNASITTLVLDFRPRLRSFGETSFLNESGSGFDGMPTAVR